MASSLVTAISKVERVLITCINQAPVEDRQILIDLVRNRIANIEVRLKAELEQGK